MKGAAMSDDRPLWEQYARNLSDDENAEDLGTGSYQDAYPSLAEESVGWNMAENRRLARHVAAPPEGRNVPDLTTMHSALDPASGQYGRESWSGTGPKPLRSFLM
jgi:hypothetical protein